MAIIDRILRATIAGPTITTVDLYHTEVLPANLIAANIPISQLTSISGYSFQDEESHNVYICTANGECVGVFAEDFVTPPPVPTPTPTPTSPTPTPGPTPTPAPPANCETWSLLYPSNASNNSGTFYWTCCDGIGSQGSITLGLDQDYTICIEAGTSVYIPQGGSGSKIQDGGCFGCEA